MSFVFGDLDQHGACFDPPSPKASADTTSYKTRRSFSEAGQAQHEEDF
jgi:hypothetical protein